MEGTLLTGPGCQGCRSAPYLQLWHCGNGLVKTDPVLTPGSRCRRSWGAGLSGLVRALRLSQQENVAMNLDPETLFELLDRQLLAPIGTVSSTPALLIEGSDATQGPT